MHHVQLTDTVRQLVTETFAELGVPQPDQMQESILIRDGSYCGRRFQAIDASAVWFVEEDQVKFYQADGTVACVLKPLRATYARMAA